MYPINLYISSRHLEQLAQGLSRVQLPPPRGRSQGEAEGGESKAPARSNSARQGLEGQSTSASQALPVTESKKPFHSFLPLASASLRKGRKTKA